MKKISYFLILFWCIIIFLFTYQLVYAGAFKWIRVGKYQNKVVDSGDQGRASGNFCFYYFNDFSRRYMSRTGWHIGCIDWTDENGTYYPYWVSGAGFATCDEARNTIPVPDAEGTSINRYFRYRPPTVTVDGFVQTDPFPLEGDEEAPDKIPGTADVMVESWINTSMGITINQRVLGWSQTNHDDYIIYDWTFTNTGNVDLDDDIELPNQTVKDFYYLRTNNFMVGSNQPWYSGYGEYPADSLRMMYAYPARSKGSSTDDVGNPRSSGYLRRPCYFGEAMLHIDKSVDDHSDDPSQPHMTDAWKWIDELGLCSSLGIDNYTYVYQLMKEGLKIHGTTYMEGTYPGTHHGLRLDEQGMDYVLNFPFWKGRGETYTSSGPYTLEPGQHIRMVFAQVMGSLSIEKAWEIGKAWQNGTCTWDGPDDLTLYYPTLVAHPELAPTDNDKAKDRWVYTAKDSLFNNAWAAQWAVRNDYNVPIPPPSPSIEIKSLPDKINITWGNESESASDFAGYRVYRAVGDQYYSEDGGIIVGKFTPIFECGEGTANPTIVHEYDDTAAERGLAYYYYVTAFDDGIGNIPDVNGKREILESGAYLNRTTIPAHLTRAAGTLSTVRIVPNPFNIGAAELQYIGEPNKIMFMDVPGYCTIKIYSESGDLVKTLYHTSGSGDESWGVLSEEHSATEIGQIIVSGIYIAFIEENNEDGTPTGNSTALKFVVVR